jgi:K+-transporting ATPase ATPase B chain
MARYNGDVSALEPRLLLDAGRLALRKLNPLTLVRNPVLFAVEIVSALATCLVIADAASGRADAAEILIVVWFWLTILAGNFAEALAECLGQRRADSLGTIQQDISARRLLSASGTECETIPSGELHAGDIVLVEAGDLIPADGEVIEGIASVDESPMTGESAAVIREAGGERSGVTSGTKVLSDRLTIRVSARPAGTMLDRLSAKVEGANLQKTPGEIALATLLVGQTIVFLIVPAALGSFISYSGAAAPPVMLLALAVTLMPTTIGALLSAIGIAAMDRVVKANVIAKSARAVEACGDVNTLLLDKTGTITVGNRVAEEFKPLPGTQMRELVEAAYLASHGDATPEGKSIVELARRTFRELAAAPEIMRAIPFSAEMRISGADLAPRGEIRKGPEDAIKAYAEAGDNFALTRIVQDIARTGGTPIVVARDRAILGVIHLKDSVKPGLRDRFQQLRRMGVRTVLITGDNALTAAAIAAEAGVDDVMAEATPEQKLELIRKLQAEGRLVAMCGDGSNDAPALAQADVGVAMNDGTEAAREAANLVDLDNDPTKLVDVVRIAREMLITRGALTTFSMTSDLAKYLTVLPPLLATAYPGLGALNILGMHSPGSAMVSAMIFNVVIIAALTPLALRGVTYEPLGAEALLGRNLLNYGLAGLVVPLFGIKAIDMMLTGLGAV